MSEPCPSKQALVRGINLQFYGNASGLCLERLDHFRAGVLMAVLARLLQNHSGATAMEYGFIAGVVSIAVAGIWNVLGLQLAVLSAQIATSLGFSGVIVAG